MVGGEGQMVKLIYGSHKLDIGRLTKDEKIIIGNMTKSMVKPKNILLTLKKHNATSSTTVK